MIQAQVGVSTQLPPDIFNCVLIGSIFLHPHPVHENPDGLVLFILSNKHESLEQLARLFPIRTGVAGPSWVVTSSLLDQIGAGGVRGTG